MNIPRFRSIRQRFRTLGSPGAFKGYFFVVGTVLTVAFLFDARTMVKNLERNQRELIQAYGVFFITMAASEQVMEGPKLSLLLSQIEKMQIPIVVTDAEGTPTSWKGIDIPQRPGDPDVLTRVRDTVADMDQDTQPVLLEVGPGLKMYLHYRYSPSVTRMRWLPFVEIGIAGLFVLIGLVIYRNTKQLEQRYIWIGMAKETAHQFGTPLSALMGWIELIRLELYPDDGERRAARRKFDRIIHEMTGDVARLQKIASRFGQIGSVPELHRQDLRPLIADSAEYFRNRVPHQDKRVEIRDVYADDAPLAVDINRDLLEWVIENLLKNSLDATEGRNGLIRIDARHTPDGRHVVISIEDNGKGIPVHAHKKAFDPGYTTKKRGWGLGLSLARRIIEEYHRGKLSLRESRPGMTIFEIMLPVSQYRYKNKGDADGATTNGR